MGQASSARETILFAFVGVVTSPAAHAGSGLNQWKWGDAGITLSSSSYNYSTCRGERWSPRGSAIVVAEFLAPYVGAGCTLFNLIINGREGSHELESAGEIRAQLTRLAGSS
jgi:hypothetical protein